MKLERLQYDIIFSVLPLVTYVIFLGAGAIFVGSHQKFGWDMLAYIGVIESWRTSDSTLIQNQAYSSIRSLPDYDQLRGNGTCLPPDYVSYRTDVAHNSNHFAQQLPIAAIKPLYVIILSVLHRGGLSYVRSFAIISAVVFCGLGAITWLWLSLYWSKWAATMFGFLLLVNPEILSIIRSTSPDALALMFLIFGFTCS